MCQAWLTCDDKRLYGSKTSFTQCASTPKGPTSLTDTKPTPKDGDAELTASFDTNEMTLSDIPASGGSYAVHFRIEPPSP